MVMLRGRCPDCDRSILQKVRPPFVRVRIQCRCGVEIVFRNPRLLGTKGVSRRLCLDCGEPIPVRIRGHHTVSGQLRWTCPVCWEKHRNDEPGDDLDTWIVRWWRRQLRLAKVSGDSRIEGRTSLDSLEGGSNG